MPARQGKKPMSHIVRAGYLIGTLSFTSCLVVGASVLSQESGGRHQVGLKAAYAQEPSPTEISSVFPSSPVSTSAEPEITPSTPFLVPEQTIEPSGEPTGQTVEPTSEAPSASPTSSPTETPLPPTASPSISAPPTASPSLLPVPSASPSQVPQPTPSPASTETGSAASSPTALPVPSREPEPSRSRQPDQSPAPAPSSSVGSIAEVPADPSASSQPSAVNSAVAPVPDQPRRDGGQAPVSPTADARPSSAPSPGLSVPGPVFPSSPVRADSSSTPEPVERSHTPSLFVLDQDFRRRENTEEEPLPSDAPSENRGFTSLGVFERTDQGNVPGTEDWVASFLRANPPQDNAVGENAGLTNAQSNKAQAQTPVTLGANMRGDNIIAGNLPLFAFTLVALSGITYVTVNYFRRHDEP